MSEEYLQISSNGFGSSARKSLNVLAGVYKDTVANSAGLVPLTASPRTFATAVVPLCPLVTDI